MKKISVCIAAALSFGAGTLIHQGVGHAQASGVGQLRGVVKDKGTNEAAVGATVVATSPALQGEQVVITDESGQYFVTSLPAGVYTLTVYYQDSTYAKSNVTVQVGKEIVVNLQVNTASATPKGETIVISGSAPLVDQGSTKTGITLTEDYTKNVPTGRTFGATMGAAAGSQGDLYGVSFAGSTSVENTYVIEGINTTDTAFGKLSSNLPNEFISETEVITGGYNAEYGRATGGIVNVVTKQGSNEFHGSIFGNISPSSFTASAKTVQTEGGSVDFRTDSGNIWDAGFELGGPIIKDKLWFHVGFDPSVSNSVATRIVQSQVDENQDGTPDVDPATGLTRHSEVSRSQTNGDAKTYYFTAKINGAVDQNNQFQISAFGNPTNGTTPTGTGFTGGPTALTDNGLGIDQGAMDVSAKWTSKLNNGKTQIDAVAGYHHATTKGSPTNATTGESLVIYNYTRSLNDFADIEGSQISAKCQDGGAGDLYPKIQNCPVLGYQESGLGVLADNTNDRATAS
ncbi:MAG TPA: carboxypeptidase regulatory-like domain-containing protein, partial [Kofleriaceae bacterium]